MRILIVDNSVQITERLEEILSESAMVTSVYKSVSYPEAILLFKQNVPDVVLLDIFLPGNDSINLLKEIKKTGNKTSIVILFVQTDNLMQEQYKLLGVNSFFDKYHDFEKIPAFINAIATNNYNTQNS